MSNSKGKKQAIVHEFLHTWGGAERVLKGLINIYPNADVVILTGDPAIIKKHLPDTNVKRLCSWIPSWFHKHPKWLLPFFPIIIEQFETEGYDEIITSSNSFAKGIITSPDTIHTCYCHAPTRYLWDYKTKNEKHSWKYRLLSPILNLLKKWDYVAAQRVDHYIANSKTTAQRIKKYYGRESVVIEPPVRTEYFTPIPQKEKGEHYITISRLSPYKKVQETITACKKAKVPLVVIGTGKQYKQFKKQETKDIKILGWQSDKAVKQYLETAKALIFPVNDDFGIIVREALAAGTPVIALNKGGAKESIVHKKTGLLIEKPTIKQIKNAIQELEKETTAFNTETLRSEAEKYSIKHFRQRFQEELGRN